MKNIFKYIFISFGLLFLVSFFFVEKTYGIDPGSGGGCTRQCLCGRRADCTCNPCACTCPCGCSGTRANGSRICTVYSPPSNCTCGYHNCGAYGCSMYCCNTVYSVSREGCVRDGNICTAACECDTNHCESGCNDDGSCKCLGCKYGCYSTGECKPVPICNVYDGYCEDEHGAGSYSIWSDISESCVCVEPTTSGGSCSGTQCADGTCCAPGTICQQFSGAWICTLGEPDPGDGGDTGGDTCTEEDSICDPTQYCDDNGWTTTPTPYLLENVVSCISRINCADEKTYGDCYEDPSINNNPDDPATGTLNDIQTLKVTMGDSESEWVEQETEVSLIDIIKDFFKMLSMLMY